MNSLFISSQGSIVFDVIDILKEKDEEIKKIKNWHISGNSSLIFLFKILGYNYEEIKEELKELKLIGNMINYSSLMSEDEENKLIFLKNWIKNKLNKNELFNENITLGEIIKHYNWHPYFIVYCKEENSILSLDDSSLKLIDCIMSTLPSFGFFNEYNFSNKTFKNVFNIDIFPYLNLYTISQNTLYICFILSLDENENKEERSFFYDIENELLSEYCDRNNYKVKGMKRVLGNNNIIIKRII